MHSTRMHGNEVPPQLSVVIPTHDRCTLLCRVLPTVFQQSCSPDAYEVIVVVDGSTDGTVEMLRQFHPSCKFQFLEQPNWGQASARNVGVKSATGGVVLLLDDDLLCEPTLVAEHIGAHRSNANQIVFGPVNVAPESPRTLATRRINLEAAAWVERLGREGPTLPFDAVVGANSSMRRTTFLDLGGFDDKFFRAREDVELGLRCWLAGVAFRFHGAAVTYQIYVKNSRDIVMGDGIAYGQKEVVLYRKHGCARRYSEFAHFATDGVAKRLIRELASRLFVPFDFVASVPCWLAEHGPENGRLERLGLRCLALRRNTALLSSAVREAGGWSQFKQEFAVRIPVFLFHNVGPVRAGTSPTLTISRKQFERQMRWLKRRGYVGIRCCDWLAWLRGEKILPKKSVVLTFDDAYADIAENALPILKKYGFSATVFVVTDQIGGTNAWDEREGSATLHCMNAEQIRQWAAEGIEFGAHTRTHANLATLTEDELAHEIDGSCQDLSNVLGVRVRSFAYPYGGYSEATRNRVEKVFDLACTCDEGLNGLGTDPALLRRTMLRPNDTLLDLAFYLRRGSSPINRLRDLWHRLKPVDSSRRPLRTAELSQE